MNNVMAKGMGAKLQETVRIWLGLSDRVTCRGSFSTPPPVAYPPPDTFLQLRNCATTPMPASCIVAWLQQNEGGALNPRWARYSVSQRATRSQITWRRYSLLAPFPKCARRSEAD